MTDVPPLTAEAIERLLRQHLPYGKETLHCDDCGQRWPCDVQQLGRQALQANATIKTKDEEIERLIRLREGFTDIPELRVEFIDDEEVECTCPLWRREPKELE